MGYTYRDTTTGVPPANTLPAEAVSIDGQYIENAISGYQTLYVSGRESLAVEFDNITVGTSDGETLKNKRYPARTIVVGFQLIASSASDFRSKFNHLNNLLSMDEADFVFADETDKFFTGVPIMDIEVDPGRNSVKGEWQIYCAYPFKRSTAVKTVTLPTSTDDYSKTYSISYLGTYPTRPVLRAKFAGALAGGSYSDDGDCGYVAFINDNEAIIQLGNPDAIDYDAYSEATQLVNQEFSTVSGWQTSGGKTWGNKAIDGSVASTNVSDAHWNKDTGWNLPCAVPSYGSGSAWHGPILHKTLNGVTGAVNFNISAVHRMAVSDNTQIGSFELGAYNVVGSTYKMVAGIVIEKTSAGTMGVLNYIVNDEVVNSVDIDLSYYNTNFGYCDKQNVYQTQYYNKKKKKWQTAKIKKAKTRSVVAGLSYTQSSLNIQICKSEDTVTFKVGNLSYTYTDSAIRTMVTHDLSIHFGQKGTNTALNTNAVRSILFTSIPSGKKFADVANVFTAGDIVEADCNDASVYLFRNNTVDGQEAPQYGALGNDWEDFVLTKGTNTITVCWSEWASLIASGNYAPEITIEYNEVYI